MLKKVLIGLALVGALLLATAIPASAADRNHDRIRDRWEKRHHLSLAVKQTRRDQDHDGLRNLAEFKAHMDPRDDDSDDDGVEDGDENAGKVSSFADGTLTIALFGGGEVSGKVTEATEIECEGGDDQGDDNDDQGDDDNSGPGSDDSGPGGDDAAAHSSSDDDGGEDDEGEDCGTDALTEGAVVHEAELDVTDAGAVWDEIELG